MGGKPIGYCPRCKATAEATGERYYGQHKTAVYERQDRKAVGYKSKFRKAAAFRDVEPSNGMR